MKIIVHYRLTLMNIETQTSRSRSILFLYLAMFPTACSSKSSGRRRSLSSTSGGSSAKSPSCNSEIYNDKYMYTLHYVKSWYLTKSASFLISEIYMWIDKYTLQNANTWYTTKAVSNLKQSDQHVIYNCHDTTRSEWVTLTSGVASSASSSSSSSPSSSPSSLIYKEHIIQLELLNVYIKHLKNGKQKNKQMSPTC